MTLHFRSALSLSLHSGDSYCRKWARWALIITRIPIAGWNAVSQFLSLTSLSSLPHKSSYALNAWLADWVELEFVLCSLRSFACNILLSFLLCKMHDECVKKAGLLCSPLIACSCQIKQYMKQLAASDTMQMVIIHVMITLSESLPVNTEHCYHKSFFMLYCI